MIAEREVEPSEPAISRAGVDAGPAERDPLPLHRGDDREKELGFVNEPEPATRVGQQHRRQLVRRRCGQTAARLGGELAHRVDRVVDASQVVQCDCARTPVHTKGRIEGCGGLARREHVLGLAVPPRGD